jgi:FkbM family methyltransferase
MLIAKKIGAWIEILRHFKNPLLITAMRLGLFKQPFFAYRINMSDRRYLMLARPAATHHSDLFVLREVLVKEEYSQILPLLPSSPVRLLDVGANLGSFSIWLNQRHGIKEALCFEPEPISASLCRFNLANNGCEAATLIPKALGGQEREIDVWVNSSRPGSINIYGQPSSLAKGRQRVEVVALADWLQGVEGDFDLLKLDCEGAEWEIVRNTEATMLQRFKVLVAEVHADPIEHSAIGEFRNLIEAAGFITVRDDNCYQGLFLACRIDWYSYLGC